MKLTRPSRQDLDTCRRTIETFEGASGSFNFMGEFQPDANHPFALWMMLPITRDKADELWINQSIDTQGDQTGYADMLTSENYMLYMKYFKVKTGMFSSRWVGNLKLLFDAGAHSFGKNTRQIDIGSVGGDSQNVMWEHFRRVLVGKDRLFSGTMQAIEGVGYMGD